MTAFALTYAITYAIISLEMMHMEAINMTNARQNLYSLAERAIETSVPIRIIGKKGDVVMLSADDYDSLQETVHLLSVPGMRESLLEGMKASVEDCATLEDIGWGIE